MSDTTTCPSCSATLPAGAVFCTTCGTRLSPAPETPVADATRVDNPGLHDTTQVYSPPPAAPDAPWQPADAATPPPPPPGPPPAPAGWGAPAAAPPPAPAPPPPAAWPPAAPTAAPPTTWGAPGSAPAPPATWNASPAPAWGAPAPAAAPSSGGGSPFGGVLALLGGVLVLVGLFTAWLGSNVGDETVTGWELLDADNGFETSDPYLLLGLAIAGLALAVALFLGVARTAVRIVAVLVGAAVVITHIRDWMDIADIAKALPQGVEITAQFGFYIGIVGGVLLAIAALLPAKK